MGQILYETIEWNPPGQSHGHQVLIPFDAKVGIPTTEYEDLATDLAMALERCNKDRFQGRGRTHSHEDVKAAFQMGVQQLLQKRPGEAYKQLLRRIALFRKWGGQVPAAVLLPTQDDPQKWKMAVPDRHGDPVFYDVKKKVLEDIIPPPTDSSVKAVPDKAGIGYLTRPKDEK